MDDQDLVTGGAGFVGSHLAERLLALGRRVRVLDDLSTGRPANLSACSGHPRFALLRGSVTDRGAVAAAMDGVQRAFHLAALADIVPSIENPEAYFQANVAGTLAVLEAARAGGVSRFVYAASSSSYGVPDVYPTPETAPAKPRHPYALTKHLAESLVLHWAEAYKLPAVSLRLFNVYGPRSRTAGAYGAVFGVFLAQMLAGKPLTVVGDGTQTRDFTFVADVVEAIRMAADSSAVGEAFNVGSGEPVSVNRLVELLGAKAVVHIPKRPGEPDATHADISKIRARIGWRPRTSFEDGVAKVLARIEDWRDAPVWTPETIAEATRSWFRHLAP
jgi:UDP-glucose 4-epimerase